MSFLTDITVERIKVRLIIIKFCCVDVWVPSVDVNLAKFHVTLALSFYITLHSPTLDSNLHPRTLEVGVLIMMLKPWDWCLSLARHIHLHTHTHTERDSYIHTHTYRHWRWGYAKWFRGYAGKTFDLRFQSEKAHYIFRRSYK